ncbi:hypothetical protein [Tenacibaculum sp. MAR_2009_124]|uniref:hypothetical protein n=1 Tax=Tenacibaculum sp. MAR_2009_124 TaxID=1250059 RepID=UPI0011600111|nr:hypothetical protein [Tenacibaculum sp. MAR_2009_124]
MKTLFPLLVCVLYPFITYSQEDGKGTIDAQRPTLTESFSIVLPNMLQFESGLDYFNDSSDVTFNTFLRGSVTKRIELRASTDYKTLNTVGAKFVVMTPEKTALGIGTSFIYNRDLVNNSNDFKLAMSKSFEKFFVTYNIGYTENFYNIFLIGTSIGNQFNYFIEYYNDNFLNRIHTGVTWIPHRDIQLDINGGWMDSDTWYTGLGVSFRLR